MTVAKHMNECSPVNIVTLPVLVLTNRDHYDEDKFPMIISIYIRGETWDL